MKGLKFRKMNKDKFKASFKTRAFHAGGYSVAAAAIVVAIAVALNLFVSALPTSVTQLDVTSNKIYSISEETEKVLEGLDDKIEIYWIAQEGQEDSTLEGLLDKYKGLSNKIKVIKKDPDVYPGFVAQYTDSSINNNSLIVVNGDKYRYVDYYDIYEYSGSDYYSYDVNFAGEGAITGAIDYVSRENLPVVYTLTGHGEDSLSTGFQSAVENENIDVKELSLVSEGMIPEDADSIIINAPETDISAEEKTIIEEYLSKGGNLMLISAPQKSLHLENIEALMSGYGVNTVDGIIFEASQNNYAWNSPQYILPEIEAHEITEPLKEKGYYILMPIAQGLKISDTGNENIAVSELLKTSEAAYSKTNVYETETYEKEDGDIDGPFDLAVAITNTIDEKTESNIVWITSSYLLDDRINSQVSGGNQDFFLNSISWLCGAADKITIHAKSLSNEYLTIGNGAATILTVLVVGIIPLTVLIIGIYIWIRRKRR